MSQSIIAVYETLSQARAVVDELTAAGFDREEISLVAGHQEGETAVTVEEGRPAAGVEPREAVARGAVTGGAIGGVGGLVLGAAAVAFPGIGLLVAGPILAIYGAMAGTLAGGLLGLLVQSGIPEEAAPYYAEGLQRGMAVVSLDAAGEKGDRARQILDRHRPVNMAERVAEWRRSGWTGYTGEVSNETSPEAPEKSHLYATGEMDDAAYGRDGTERGPTLPDYDGEEDRRD